MSITLEGDAGGEPWHLTFEFTYQSSELVYVKPSAEHIEQLPQAAHDFRVAHVPQNRHFTPSPLGRGRG